MKLSLVMSELFLEWYENHPEELQKTIRRIATLPVPQSGGLSKLWCLQRWSNWDFISCEENAALVVFAAPHPDLLCDSELAQKCINAVAEMQGTALRTLQIDSAEQSVAAVNRAVQENPLRLIFALASSRHVPRSSGKRGVSFGVQQEQESSQRHGEQKTSKCKQQQEPRHRKTRRGTGGRRRNRCLYRSFLLFLCSCMSVMLCGVHAGV